MKPDTVCDDCGTPGDHETQWTHAMGSVLCDSCFESVCRKMEADAEAPREG